MSIDKNPDCPFVKRFSEDLLLNGKSPRTVQSYARALRKFIEYLGQAPDQASEDHLRNYLLFVTEQKRWSPSTVNVALQALKLYFRITCPRDWPILSMARVQVEQKLPVVISVGEVHTLLKIIDKPSMRCFFTIVYALGLRLNEALHLQIADIDSKRMLVHVHRGKGAKDRMVPLPEMALQALRQFWVTHRNPLWLFPAEGRNRKRAATAQLPMSESSVQGVIKAALEQLNWSQRGISTHTLRHCYATHLLEAGVSLKLIQKYIQHGIYKGVVAWQR